MSVGVIGGQNSSLGQTASVRPASPQTTEVPRPEPRKAADVQSPVVEFDRDSGLLLLQFLSTETGDVKAQFPAEHVVKNYTQRAGEHQQPDRGQHQAKDAAAPRSAEAESAGKATDEDRPKAAAQERRFDIPA